MRLLLVCVIVVLASASACAEFTASRRSPSQGYRYIELAIHDGFESQGAWRGYEGAGVFLGVRNGAFLIDILGRQYVWTQGETQLDDVVLEADLKQTSSYDHNAFGLACRLDPTNTGRGYYFLISGDGYASIRWSNGRSLEQVVAAQPSAHVKRSGARNRLRAVCIGEYLALWVNDHFVVEARDRRASTGAVGLAGVMNYEGKRLTLAIDNLEVWRAALDDRAP
ncbi:MAG: hypothetical protein OXG78_10525 [Chloroflexi bacterium]|nr:hypothetical protein [Chloroflexota bacterium]